MVASAEPKAPGRYHHGELRDSLIAAALEVVEAEGVDEVRLRALARRLEVNHRSVYRHFADREELITEVAIEGWRKLGEKLKHARSGHATPVRNILRAYIHFALTHGGHYRCMLGRGSSTRGPNPRLREATLDAVRIVEAEVGQQMNARGAPVRDQVFALWGLAHGLCDLALSGHARVSSTRKTENWILRLMEPLLQKAKLK